ncbi:MAG: hypothetical protein E7365_07525 [Clostridiales bacterium]|nr:hypothetical protein [Clostridiales bacterium]
MAIRKVVFNVLKEGVTPSDYQWGGIQNEDNATEIVFVIDEEYLSLIEEGGGELKYRIDFNSSFAGYQPSENLLINENAVKRTIPKNISCYGGEFACNLVITRLFESGTTEEILTVPVTLFFTSSQRQDARVIGNLCAFEENILKKVSEAKQYSVDAEETFEKIKENFDNNKYVLNETDTLKIVNIIKQEFVDVSEVAK